MTELLVSSRDVRIWTEQLGDPAASPLLLIMGANASSMGWPDEFVRLLTEGGHRVIRFDNRDTGRSSMIPADEASYDVTDMTRDAIAVLDAYGIDSAHIAGCSLGGFIAQIMAIECPDRVRTMTLLLSGPLDMETDDGTGQPDAERLTAVIALAEPGADRESELDHRVAMWRELHGSTLPFDAAEYRALEERVIDHAGTIASQTGHIRLGSTPLPYGAEGMRGIRTPTLMVQGTEDPFFAPGHGRHVVELIRGAALLRLEGLGHALPAAVHREIAESILLHTGQHRALSGSG